MSSAKKKIKGLATIRISQLEDKKITEVWVLNETKPKGLIALEVKNRADGSATLVSIPPTWVPICLTDQVPKTMLVDSPKFRAILAGGYIKLLDPNAVTEILLDKDVQEEIDSIRNKTADYFKETLPENLQVENTVSVVVLDLLVREGDGSITEAEAKDILNNREEELTDADLEHLMKSSNSAKVKKWASDTLAERTSEE
jgi:hypothetical protein